MFRDWGFEGFLVYILLSISSHKSTCQDCPEHTCNWKTTVKYPFPMCYCDSLCHIYEDCCVDVTTRNLESNINHKTLNSTFLSFDDRNCMALPQAFGFYGFRVVDKCNGRLCPRDPFEIQSILPVTISTGKTFLNAECARCNGQSDFRFWDILLYKPNPTETLRAFKKKNATDEEIIRILLKSKSNLINYKLSLSLDDIMPPRFCVKVKDVRDTCPKYLSPVVCGTAASPERNGQCAQLNGNCKQSQCKLPFDPFYHYGSYSLYLSVLIKLREDENSDGKRSERYHIKVQNPTVYLFISYISGSYLSKTNMSRFFGALYISLKHHSGYNFKSLIPSVQYNIVNCTLNDSCFHYQFRLRLIAEIIEDEKFIQDLLNKDIKLVYKDTNLGFTILMANLSFVSFANRKSMVLWFREYSDSTGTFKTLSEMKNCKILSILATFHDENLTAVVMTKCTRRLSETYVLSSKGSAKSVNMLINVVMYVLIYGTIS